MTKRQIARRRAFDFLSDEPCSVCQQLATDFEIQAEAVMPLPIAPPTLKTTGQKICRDCQSAETVMRFGGHPKFGPSRLTVANERLESLRMPRGMAEHFGMCSMGFVDPASMDDLESHIAWLKKHHIYDSQSQLGARQ